MLQEGLIRLQDPMSILPPEVTLEIFSYLIPEELLVIRQVNKLWNGLANSECLWRKFCEEKELLDYTATVAYDKTPITNFCNSAKTYLSFEKTLKNNWISGRSHVLSELSSAITESLICWKRMFVRTYKFGTVFDIFTVDSQCNVHRLQRIDTRLNFEGIIRASLNENWLGITRLNALLLYQRDSSGEYNLKWILTLMNEEFLILQYLYVNNQTLDKQIDEFINRNLKQHWEVSCMCLYPDYVWMWIKSEYLIIKLEHNSKEAVISHKFGSDLNDICYDKKGIAVIQYDKVGIYEPDATLKFIYSVDEYRTVEHEVQIFDGLTQSPSSVAFIDKTNARSMIILDRKSYKLLRMNDLFPLLVALHPSKPLAFALFYMYSNGPSNRKKINDELWTMRCYSCIDGQIIWENSQMTYLPDIHKFLVINKKFLLLTPVRPGLCKFSFFDCSSGKLLSIIEEDSHPLSITDIFTVCCMFKRSKEIFVKCYL